MNIDRDQKIGEYQCILEFWGFFVETMTDRFNELFKVKVATNYIRKSDDQLLKSIPDVYNYINIPIPKTAVSISSIVAGQFLDEEAENYNVYPKDQAEYGDLFSEPLTERLSIPVKSTVTFSNRPNVLVFGIKRLNYNPITGKNELNEVPVDFDHLILKGELYVPVASIIFCRNHYYAILRDVKNADFYLHNDTRIDFISDPQDNALIGDNLMKKTVMMFYVKLSALQEFKNTKFDKVQANEDIPSRLVKEKAPKKPAVTTSGEKKSAKRKKRSSDYSYRKKRRKLVKKSVKKSEKIDKANASNDDDQDLSDISALPERFETDEESKVVQEDVLKPQNDGKSDEKVEDLDEVSLRSKLLDEIVQSQDLYNQEEVISKQEEICKAQKVQQ